MELAIPFSGFPARNGFAGGTALIRVTTPPAYAKGEWSASVWTVEKTEPPITDPSFPAWLAGGARGADIERRIRYATGHPAALHWGWPDVPERRS